MQCVPPQVMVMAHSYGDHWPCDINHGHSLSNVVAVMLAYIPLHFKSKRSNGH